MSPEARRLLNLPFLAAINASASLGYSGETGRAIPLLYCFVIPPMVLHKDTRDRLPKVVTTKMPAWAQENAGVLAELPSHIANLQSLVRHSIILGCNMGFLSFTDTREVAAAGGVKFDKLSKFAHQSSEVSEIFKRAHFLGRWLTTAGNVPTVFSVLGIGLQNETL